MNNELKEVENKLEKLAAIYQIDCSIFSYWHRVNRENKAGAIFLGQYYGYHVFEEEDCSDDLSVFLRFTFKAD